MKITIIGSGYVGLTTGVCLSHLGHQVVCVDNDVEKIKLLKQGISPIYEPGLEELLKEGMEKGTLSFTDSIEEGTKHGLAIFICVGTPPREDGSADLSSIEFVATRIAETMDEYKLIIEKSTVPVQTGLKLKTTIELNNKRGIEFDVASNPEFLREGSAIKDFLYPDRIVIGVENERAEKLMREIYEKIDAPFIVTNIQSAEIIKHASNSFLAMKISYINAVSMVCEKAGADVKEVARGMGLDHRIGKEFLNAGIGFGGFCFPKDLKAFIKISEDLGYHMNLLREVLKINQEIREYFITKVRDLLWNIKGKKIAILGLSFKPNTDDIREAPSIYIIKKLLKEGANISAYDPAAMEKMKKIFPDIDYKENPYDTLGDANALLILTEWEE
ncbi:UDP-glucose 6-dehydrogenase, partial [bacterium]